MIIAIDGPAGAGKSTTARLLAERLGFAYLNTGAMYRAIALFALEQNLRLPQDETKIVELAQTLPISFADKGRKTFVEKREVSDEINAPQVSAFASKVSALAGVRDAMVLQQRRLAQELETSCGGAVLEGRDIQTVVCPDAEVKIFLVADSGTRAGRRLLQWQQKDESVSEEDARRDVEERDERDQNRQVAPLMAAPDALHLSTDGLSAQDVVARIAEIVERKLRQQ